jgi:hypothetical protein
MLELRLFKDRRLLLFTLVFEDVVVVVFSFDDDKCCFLLLGLFVDVFLFEFSADFIGFVDSFSFKIEIKFKNLIFFDGFG